jgi:tRNA-Thr(GGU) m(6)t(6)A37 methyltransferase TsaA
MGTEQFLYEPIGYIHTPFKESRGTPIQPTGAAGVAGRIELHSNFAPGLRDLEGFSHIVLVYHFHRAKEAVLQITPFMDTEPRGLFATRAPNRPNPIGISTVQLLRIEGNMLYVESVDILDGTPLLDIKPYVPAFEPQNVDRIGWLTDHTGKAKSTVADDRFG